MGWNPMLISVADGPVINFDINAVANEANILHNVSATFADQAHALTRTWGDLANTYITSHTATVVTKMDEARASAERGQRVYEHVAWTLDQFVREMRECRPRIYALEET